MKNDILLRNSVIFADLVLFAILCFIAALGTAGAIGETVVAFGIFITGVAFVLLCVMRMNWTKRGTEFATAAPLS